MIKSIVAFDINNLIGADGAIIWKIKEDMKHFKDLTMGNICVMGRVTWESIPEKFRPLEGRKNIVVTSDPNYAVPDGVLIAPSYEDAKALAQNLDTVGAEFFGKDIYVCGGQRLYESAMDDVDVLEVTEIGKEYPTERLTNLRYFPEIDPLIWWPAEYNSNKTDEGLIYDFITYKRRKME